MYDFTVRNLHYVVSKLDADGDGWPEGLGNVERTGMGPEKLDNTVYFIRGLYDLADMAQSKHDTATYTWATDAGQQPAAAGSTATWWYAGGRSSTPTRSTPDNSQSFQKHWIGQTPMEAELHVERADGARARAVRPRQRGAGRSARTTATAALRRSTRGCSTPAAAVAPDGLGEKVIYGLTTSIQSIGEGNYGRLGAGPAGSLHRRARRDDVRRARDRRYAGRAAGRDAGDLPVAGPGREHRPLLDLPLDVHAGLGQLRHRVGRSCTSGSASGPTSAGTRSSSCRRCRRVRRTVPGKDIRLGGGSADVLATHAGSSYSTEITTSRGVGADDVEIGQTLPSGTQPTSVLLDGHVVHRYQVAQTNRGTEVTVPTTAGHHTLTVTG